MAETTTKCHNEHDTTNKKCRTRTRRPDMQVYVPRAKRSEEGECESRPDSSVSRSGSSSNCTKTPSPPQLSPIVPIKRMDKIKTKIAGVEDSFAPCSGGLAQFTKNNLDIDVHVSKTPNASVEKIMNDKTKPPKKQLTCNEGKPKKLRQGKRERAMQDVDWRMLSPSVSKESINVVKDTGNIDHSDDVCSSRKPVPVHKGPPATTRKPVVQPQAVKRPADIIREMMLKSGIQPSPPPSPIHTSINVSEAIVHVHVDDVRGGVRGDVRGDVRADVRADVRGDDESFMLDCLPKSLDEFENVDRHLILEKKLSIPLTSVPVSLCPVVDVPVLPSKCNDEDRVSPDNTDLEVAMINETFEQNVKQQLLYAGNQLKDLFYGQPGTQGSQTSSDINVSVSAADHTPILCESSPDKAFQVSESMINCAVSVNKLPESMQDNITAFCDSIAVKQVEHANSERLTSTSTSAFAQPNTVHGSVEKACTPSCKVSVSMDCDVDKRCPPSLSWAGWSVPTPSTSSTSNTNAPTAQSSVYNNHVPTSDNTDSSLTSLDSCDALSLEMIEMVLSEDDAPTASSKLPKGGAAVDSWEDIDDVTLESGILEEINRIMSAKVRVETPKIDYFSADNLMSFKFEKEELNHVLEMYGFPSQCSTSDLECLLVRIHCELFSITWVDDKHVLVVFPSHIAALEALDRARVNKFCDFKLRSLADATYNSQNKAKKVAEFLQPVKPRPKTTASAARRMVEQHLGRKAPSVSTEQRSQERQYLVRAKEKKQEKARLQASAWEGE